MYRAVLLYAFLLVSCTAPNRIISYTANTVPAYKIDPPSQKFLLLNVNDVAAKKYRDNKEELFISLTDNLMEWIAGKINQKNHTPSQVLHGYTATAGNTDSTVYALMAQSQASHAIVIYSFNVYFDQTHVEVKKTYDGRKERTAFYDILSDVGYRLYSAGSMIKEKDVSRRRFHSSRSVASGLLAIGPNIVVRKDDARDIIIDNGQRYLDYYYPGEALRNRTLFTGKEFQAVSDAIVKGDYEAALVESMRFINDNNKEKAAKACYNCAVLFERKNQPEETKSYLRQSLSLFTLREAKTMMVDFED
jgi:hypothetical protein